MTEAAAEDPVERLDPRLLDAAANELSETGWVSLQVERVAARAGISRATAWRQGANRDVLLEGLLRRLAQDYRDSMWPVLTASGAGEQRLVAALNALCDVADRHLPALLASDNIFHREFHRKHASGADPDFVGPIARVLRDGAADGSLRASANPEEAAETLFNMVCWGYVHLRGRHHWEPRRVRKLLFPMLLDGVRPRGAAQD